MLEVFFDIQGLVNFEFIPKGRTVSKETHVPILRRLRDAVRRKRPNLWQGQNWVLHHDNTLAYRSLLVPKLVDAYYVVSAGVATRQLLQQVIVQRSVCAMREDVRSSRTEGTRLKSAGSFSVLEDDTNRAARFGRPSPQQKSISQQCRWLCKVAAGGGSQEEGVPSAASEIRFLSSLASRCRSMELRSYSEGAADVVVVPRHGAANGTAGCHGDAVPSMQEYYKAMNVLGVTLFAAGGAAVLLTLLLYADTLRHIMRRSPPLVKAHSAFVLSVYPVVALASYCAVVVPRAQLLAEAVTQGAFTAALYQLFCLLVAYCGGEAELIRRAKPGTLSAQVAPCCCYPCCRLPPLTLNKLNLRRLRLLVLQLPLVQGLVYLALLVTWAEEDSLYQVNYVYVQPLIILSILLGVWGMSMAIKVLAEVLQPHRPQAKFLVLQAVLLLAKFQALAARIVVWSGLVACRPPITPAVYTNLIYNSAMLGEMVVLAVVARLLYKQELPDLVMQELPPPQEICVITDKYYNTMEKPPKEQQC
ncbi:organic solute transporter alpha-like protein [Periplaneta americana]|uniref:organic solute transporter alpha-like protein n=1 Tax=Periplaneta americana TaxID=6978 RepID=UPI0037E86B88